MAKKSPGNKKTLKAVLIGLVGFLLLFSVGSMVFVKTIYDQHFLRVDTPMYTGRLRYSDVTGYDRQVVQFQSGKNRLTGYLYGEGNQKGLVVIAHGLGFRAETYLSEALYFVDHGWRVFVYDCTGTDQSEGQNTVGLPQSLLDLDAALGFVESRPDLKDLPVMLYGHSWGGYAVAAVLNDNYNHNIHAVTSIAGYNSPVGLLNEQLLSMLGPFGYLEIPFGWLYQTMLFGSTAQVTAVDGINRSGIPVFIIHGSADEAIAYGGASIIAQRGQITNPRVTYKTCSVEGRNGHNTVFKSEASNRYIEQMNKAYQELNKRYEGSIPEDVKTQYYAGIDRFKVGELDADFMDEINRFYASALAN